MTLLSRAKDHPDSLAGVVFPVVDALPSETAIPFVQAYQRYRGLDQAGGPEEEWEPPEGTPYADFKTALTEALVETPCCPGGVQGDQHGAVTCTFKMKKAHWSCRHVLAVHRSEQGADRLAGQTRRPLPK